MPSAAEAAGQQSEFSATLDQGVELLGTRQTVTFQLYSKIALAQDGFVFWVATARTIEVVGSLHVGVERAQDEDQTIGVNQVTLTAESEITEFNTIAPNTMWLGSWPLDSGGELQVAFSQRGNFYGPANLWHYAGFAVYPALSAQIVKSAADLPTGPLVSNSLPIWLSMNTFNGQAVPVYPSFLVPDNIVPPYIVAHVEPHGTEAIGAFPVIGPWPGTIVPDSGDSPLHQLASSQLMRDEVDLTLYGFTNAMAIQYLQSLIENSLSLETFGFANSPAIRDAKRIQPEIAAIAQKKMLHISANYYQSTADAVARRIILSASTTVSLATYGEVIASGDWETAPVAFVGTGTGYVYGPGAWKLAPVRFSGTGTA